MKEYTKFKPLNSAAPYLTATMRENREIEHSDLGDFLFQCTPLGFLGPLFDYPRVTSREIDVLLNISYSPPVIEHGALYASFTPSENGSGKTVITQALDADLESNLSETGRGTKVLPEVVNFEINCSAGNCSVSSDPPVLGDDGVVKVSSESVVDAARLKEIAKDAKRREKEGARRAREEAEEAERRAKAEEECPSAPTEYIGAQMRGCSNLAGNECCTYQDDIHCDETGCDSACSYVLCRSNCEPWEQTSYYCSPATTTP